MIQGCSLHLHMVLIDVPIVSLLIVLQSVLNIQISYAVDADMSVYAGRPTERYLHSTKTDTVSLYLRG